MRYGTIRVSQKAIGIEMENFCSGVPFILRKRRILESI